MLIQVAVFSPVKIPLIMGNSELLDNAKQRKRQEEMIEIVCVFVALNFMCKRKL